MDWRQRMLPGTEPLNQVLFYDADDQPPPYSTDMGAAWQIVDRLHFLGAYPDGQGGDSGFCLEQHISGLWQIRYRQGIEIARAETAPLVICQAALLFVAGKLYAPACQRHPLQRAEEPAHAAD